MQPLLMVVYEILRSKRIKNWGSAGNRTRDLIYIGNSETRDFSRKMNYPTKPLSRIVDKIPVHDSSAIPSIY